jgi:hypothetical protein
MFFSLLNILFVSKALQVSDEFRRNRRVARIEALNLVDTGTGILGEREDVDLPIAIFLGVEVKALRSR